MAPRTVRFGAQGAGQSDPDGRQAQTRPGAGSGEIEDHLLQKRLGLSLFKVHIERAGTITYRKHIFVLFQQAWQPTFGLFILVLLLGSRWCKFQKSLRTITPDWPRNYYLRSGQCYFSALFCGGSINISIGVMIFQVTPDQILDIDRKPFGNEERRAAPLENVSARRPNTKASWNTC